MTTKRTAFFMTAVDERSFSSTLRNEMPGVRFVDGARNEFPCEIASLEESRGALAWIGCPEAGALTWSALRHRVQFVRSGHRTAEGQGVLYPGRLAIDVPPGSEATRTFAAAVWAALRANCTNKLAIFDMAAMSYKRRVRNIRAGGEAAAWERGGGTLSSNAARLCYAVL